MDQKVRLVFGERLLEVSVGGDALEPRFAQQSTCVVLAQREHVEVIARIIGKSVTEPRQTFVEVFGLGGDFLAAIVEIGRASCRGRVEKGVADGGGKKRRKAERSRRPAR